MQQMKVLLSISMVMAIAAHPILAGEVKTRKNIQDKKIEQGVKSGHLTPKEAENLQAHEADIEQYRKKALSDGKITPQEAKKLHKKRMKQNKRIYHKKHNAKKVQKNHHKKH